MDPAVIIIPFFAFIVCLLECIINSNICWNNANSRISDTYVSENNDTNV